MSLNLIIFDMDGVLLLPRGYHESLRASVRRAGLALGAPKTDITEDEIARFEALNITNEWDSLAICAALTLVHIWQFDPSIRLDGRKAHSKIITQRKPDFNNFLDKLPDGGKLPGEMAYRHLLNHHAWLNSQQKAHLGEILLQCRDIYHSLTLPAHQETVLGSKAFQEHYKLEPSLDTESYLHKFDRPLMSAVQYSALRDWLKYPSHLAGILTNRPSQTPPGYLSAPEAELGVQLIGLDDLPCVGSGILGWYATNHCQLPAHILLKPNPVHALSLMQACLGRTHLDALNYAVKLWQGESARDDWLALDNAKIVIFEDSVKGLISVENACALIDKLGVHIDYTLLGVTKNPVKRKALTPLTSHIIEDINDANWFEIFS